MYEASIFERLRHRLIRQNRIYIMPTGRGVLFLTVIVILILTAATYNNNLIFILAFFLFSLYAIVMLQTHYNIKGVRLEYISSEEAFEGDPLQLVFNLTQKRLRQKHALKVRSVSRRFKSLHAATSDLTARESLRALRISVLAQARGKHKIPDVALETFYPLGLFRAWKNFRAEGEITIYPKPEGSRSLEPSDSDFGEEDLGLRTSPEGDFGELKSYQVGESYHQIAWKQFARTGNLYSKVHWGQEHRHYSIPFVTGIPAEDALRQMSLWVKKAVDENATFEMHLPSLTIASGAGSDQARRCWRALAEFEAAS